MYQEVELLSGAWDGDNSIRLSFPSSWEVMIVHGRKLPPLAEEQIEEKINNPIGTVRLTELSSGKNDVAIVIDDMSRPTPTGVLIPFILEELDNAGISRGNITVIIAGGVHRRSSKGEIAKKLGEALSSRVKVVSHDCKRDLLYLGRSTRGTPLYVNKKVYESEFVIGVGGIFPHIPAGFGGGSKIIAPGVCGFETIRYLHSQFNGVDIGGLTDNDFRDEVEEIAAQVGLDFIVNAVLNSERQIAGVFSGDRKEAHHQGVLFAKEHCSVLPVPGADIVIADTYPFDTDFHFARKGFWPIEKQQHSSRVAIAACAFGMGSHALFPIKKPFGVRLARKFKNLVLKRQRKMFSRHRGTENLGKIQKADLFIYSPGMKKNKGKRVFSHSKIFDNWNEVLNELQNRHANIPVKVAVYKCSPLHFPVCLTHPQE